MTGFRDLLPPAAVTLSVVFLGSSLVATRFVIDQTDPASLAFLRYAGALLCLLPLMAFTRRMAMSRRDLWITLAIGLLHYGIFQMLINLGLERIPASRGAVIFALIPILTLFAASALGIEAMTWNKAVATFMSLAGISLALGDKAFAADSGAADWTGEILFFIGICCGATYNAVAGRLLQTYPVMQISTLVIFPGVLFLAPIAGWEGLFAGMPEFTFAGWMAVLFLVLPAGAIGFTLFNWALQRMTPTRTAVFVPISPMVATVLGALLLDEEISPLFVIGLVFIIGGIWLANWRGRDPHTFGG